MIGTACGVNIQTSSSWGSADIAHEGTGSLNSDLLVGNMGVVVKAQSNGPGEFSASVGKSNVMAGGDLDIDLTGVDADDQSAFAGKVKSEGVGLQGLDVVTSRDGMLEVVNGIKTDSGSFYLAAWKTPGGTGSIKNELQAGPAYTDDGGNASAYALTGYRWNTADPQIRYYLKNDKYLSTVGLSTSDVQASLATAADTWDDATNQNLFYDNGVGITTKSTDKYDKVNSVAWKPIYSGALAYCTTWYNYNTVGGYYSALESDISFNSRVSWTTGTASSGVYDVQSIALHEMGHTIGLDDIYNKPEFSSDTRQVMHYYTGEKRTLGNGDMSGVWALYG